MTEEHNKASDKSNDRKYFILTQRIVWALCDDPYDYTLWSVIKDVAGEDGECYLSTDDLATLSMMSTGRVSKSRKNLISKGLLAGELRRDPGYPQPVWHLEIPDLWQENILWCAKYPGIKDRCAFKKSLHLVKPSPGEGGASTDEEPPSPHETKKNELEELKEHGAKPAPVSPKIPPITDFGLDWQLAAVEAGTLAIEDIKLPEGEFDLARAKDIANLIDMQCSGGGVLALAFMVKRVIVFSESEVKGQRKAARYLLEKGVRAEHVAEAVDELIAINYKCVNLFSITDNAVALANPAPVSSNERFAAETY